MGGACPIPSVPGARPEGFAGARPREVRRSPKGAGPTETGCLNGAGGGDTGSPAHRIRARAEHSDPGRSVLGEGAMLDPSKPFP